MYHFEYCVVYEPVLFYLQAVPQTALIAGGLAHPGAQLPTSNSMDTMVKTNIFITESI